MLTTRASTRLMDIQTAATWFDPARSTSSHLDSPHNKMTVTGNWSSASSSHYAPDQQLFVQQDPNPVRVGYATRSNRAQQRVGDNLDHQAMGVSPLLANEHTLNNADSGSANGSTVRKKRRRYGPKPEPPYQCFCGKIFKRHEHMLRHRATHDDQIKYECHICGKCFRRQDVMHRHTMTHTNRSRLQGKTRPAAQNRSPSGLSRQPPANTHSHGSVDNRQMVGGGHRREQEHARVGHTGVSQDDMLEDPLLRVGLTEYPATPTSASHNEDHHIAAAQLYTAYNGTRYTYPSHVNMQPSGYWSEMGDGGYGRASEFSTVEAPYTRMGTSMSPPPPLFTQASGLAPPEVLEPPPFGIVMARPNLGMQALPGLAETDSKMHGHEAGQYGQSWQGGYPFAHATMHATESEWSDQSPSGPSTHTFASPAWSHKGELMRREGLSSASNGTPVEMTRQLSVDPAGRWQQQGQYHPQLYQQGSMVFNKTSGPPNLFRSPNTELRRRLSTIHPSDAYCNPNADSQNIKPEAYSEVGGVGLGLFDASHGNHEPTPLSSMPGAALANDSASSYGAQPPQQSSTHASEARPDFNEKPDAPSEPLDSGSPLTDATGHVSPRSQEYSNGQDRYERTSEGQREGSSIDPYLTHDGHTSTAAQGQSYGHESKRWDDRYC